MSSSFCAACGAPLTAGARFCHRCGQPVGEAVPALRGAAAPVAPDGRAASQALPWGVAAIALLALIAMLAGNFYRRPPAAPDTAQAGPGAPLPPAAGDGADGGERPARAPDISSMSPEERALRLYNRVVLLAEQGKRDSVQFFAPMAMMSFQLLQNLTPLQRFELGRIAELAENKEITTAQADTILAGNPTHLLGLTLASSAARLRGDMAAAAQFDRRLLAAEAAERAQQRPEYDVTKVDLDSALARARRGTN